MEQRDVEKAPDTSPNGAAGDDEVAPFSFAVFENNPSPLWGSTEHPILPYLESVWDEGALPSPDPVPKKKEMSAIGHVTDPTDLRQTLRE